MKITEYLKSNILYLDGGMGTLLQQKGLAPGELPERWNITHPEVIRQIHKSYYDAGCNVVNTNTFGAGILKFSEDELERIVKAAIENAKAAAEISDGCQPKWVALDIGPLGRMLKPYGDLDFEDAVGAFAKTVRLGAKYGADLVLIETMNDSYETKAAVLAAKENSTLPVFVTNAYEPDGKLVTGAAPEAMIATLEGLGVDAIGVNCSAGPSSLAPVVEKYLELSSLPVILKPNAGLPEVISGKTVYNVKPEEFSAEISALVEKGVRIAGGCCGTTPEYIEALVTATKLLKPKAIERKHHSLVSSYTHAVTIGEGPVLIGERINPTGKKLFKEALRRNDIDYILMEGVAEQESGVHILDVNVGLPEIDEVRILKDAVFSLQTVTDLPLQIDTASAEAMEAALRIYNGKAMINSVNGKKESIESIFPLAKKYGGVVVALCLDENGIPKDAEGRVRIARKILSEAERYGIDKKNLIFDPLAMTVSADAVAAKETLKAVELIKKELGCNTSLGLSNVSFGLPGRELVNSTFFAMALERGLDAAIMNPFSDTMMSVYHSYRVLSSLDEGFADYTAYVEQLECCKYENLPAKSSKEQSFSSELSRGIIKGLKEQAASATEALLLTRTPMDIVEKEIIPSLNTVGEGFEKKTVYLPGLLMSAEAAGCAFEVIRKAVPVGSACKGAVVIATVKGDIHDIGKNIVKLILENYGFEVYDLGKDVEPEDVVDCAVKNKASLVALSALMTTTVPAMEQTVRRLKKHLPLCKVMVGGAVLTKEYADIIGADKYASDAMEAVRYAEEVAASPIK